MVEIQVQNVYDNILNESGIEELSIEQMYAVRNLLNKYIDSLYRERADKRYNDWKQRFKYYGK